MPRYFISAECISAESIRFDTSDATRLVAIRECESGHEIEGTLFDFSIDIVAPHRANNRMHTQTVEKPTVDGFIQNVLKPGRRYREISEQEYSAFYAQLISKAKHLERKRRRKFIVTEVRGDESLPLP